MFSAALNPTAVAIGILALGATLFAEPAWIKESNQNAEVLLKVIAEFSPEVADHLGVQGLDEEICDLRPHLYERSLKAMKEASEELKTRLDHAQDPRICQDLEILIQAAEEACHTAELEHQYMLPYFDIAETEFTGIRYLIDPQIPKERQAAAVVRLRKYAGMGGQPLTQLAEQQSTARLSNTKLIGPYVEEVKRSLANTDTYLEGIRDLFTNSGLQGWEEPYAQLSQQLHDYDDWVNKNILPRARTDHRLPEPIYADRLHQVGVDISPEHLMGIAQFSFSEIQHQMEALAPLVAKEKGYASHDYRDVIRELKQKQIQGEEILPFYKQRLAEIEEIIRTQHIVTLPDREARIRLASLAETAAVPSPHMIAPPLVGNTGQYGEFVLPLDLPSDEGMPAVKLDDFAFDAAAWTLTAHEARPGHELQFASIVEQGTSIARTIFARTSVNTEGWALYAEAEMQPYEPLDGQLITLQLRLHRAARAFLDPMVNLGMIEPDQARAFLEREVALSPTWAKQDVQRYMFMAPGQATSYFYGYMRLMQLRGETEVLLGTQFNRQKFNDFILTQGLLPPDLLKKAVKEEFVPSQRISQYADPQLTTHQ
ncbi:MAG: DUF885 domain-containing protein [Chlamydiia bacterium]